MPLDQKMTDPTVLAPDHGREGGERPEKAFLPTAEAIRLKLALAKAGYTAHGLSRQAGVSSATLYNYFSGATQELSLVTAQRFAKALGISVDDFLAARLDRALTPPPPSDHIRVRYHVGARAVMYDAEPGLTIPRPPGTPAEVEILAAEIVGDSLHPLPTGWHLCFAAATSDPAALLGKLAVVRHSGSPRPLVRTLRKGSKPGLYRLDGFTGAPEEDVEVVAAHRIIALTQPE